MKTIEVPVKILKNGVIEIPEEFSVLMPKNTTLKATFSVPDDYDIESQGWEKMAVREFIIGYDSEDSIYDKL